MNNHQFIKPIYILGAFLLLSIFLFSGFVSAATTWTVSSSGADFTTIQAAIADASPGDVIEVAAGNYTEAVTVDKTLTLLGAQSGVDARNRDGASESIVGTSSGGFIVTANNVVIDGFTVAGVTVCAQGGISTSSTASGYAILNNIIKDNDLGMKLRSDGEAISTVKFNLFQDNDVRTCDVAKGLQTGQLSGDVLHNALIDSNKFIGQTEGNDSYAMNFQPGTGGHSNVIISNNEVLDSSVVLGGATNFVISGNIIDINSDPDPGSITAIFISGNVNGLVVTGNTIDGKKYGFRIPEDFFGVPEVSTNIVLNDNNIAVTDSSGFSVYVKSGRYNGVLDATHNFWGSASPNFATLVSGDVNVLPWYTDKERTILPVTITSAPSTIVSSDFVPSLVDGDSLTHVTGVFTFLSRTTTYVGPAIGLDDTIKWKVTISGPSALTADMVDLDEVGFNDPDGDLINIETFHYPFSVVDGSLVALGSCDGNESVDSHNNSCVHDIGFSLDEDDVFHNADSMRFNSNAPLGLYTIRYELVDTASGVDVVLSNAYETSVNLVAPPVDTTPSTEGTGGRGGTFVGGGGAAPATTTTTPTITTGPTSEAESTPAAPGFLGGITGAAVGALGTGGSIVVLIFVVLVIVGAILAIRAKKE